MKLLLIFCLFYLPQTTWSEIIYLKDGSMFKGKLLEVSSDSVYYETSFGARLAFPRTVVTRIIFADTVASAFTEPRFWGSSLEPGSLFISFNSLKLSSKIKIYRDREFEERVRANAIEEAFYVDNNKVFSYIDSTTDKVVRNGPEKELKNEIILKDIRVSLTPGPHMCRIVIRNLGLHDFANKFDFEPLNEELELSDVVVYPARTRKVVVGIKKKKLGLGKKELRVLD